MTVRRALVTGASSGIGRALAVEVARDGGDVVLVARRRGELEEVADEVRSLGREAEVLVADLTDAADLERVAERLADDAAPVDLLVNNAGYGSFGDFADLDLDGQLGQVRLNVLALVRLSHTAAAVLRRRGDGAVLQVGSLAGFQPLPGNAVYAATKAFVSSFSQALHEELRGQGVRVTVLAPGFTRTEFQERAGVEGLAARLPAVVWDDAATVARAGLDGVAAGRAVVVPGLKNRLGAVLLRASPDVVGRRLAVLAGRAA